MKKKVLMIFALAAMILPCSNAVGQNVFTCEHYTVTLPDGFEETWKSGDILNARIDADDVLFTSSYSEEGPEASELSTYADNFEWIIKGRDGGKLLNRIVEDNKVILIAESCNEWEDDEGETHYNYGNEYHYLILFKDKVCMLGMLQYPKDKADVYEPMAAEIIKTFQLK